MPLSTLLTVPSILTTKVMPGLVLVKPGPENDHIKISDGDSSVDIWIDGSYEPEKHAVTFGECVVVPENQSDLLVGDTVFFHYLCCMNAIRDRKYVICDDQVYYIVNIESCFVAKRGIEIIPLNGTVLVEAIDDSLPEKNEWGMEIPVAKRTKNHLNEGIVIHAGRPTIGEEQTCEVGNRVFWRTGAAVPLQYFLFSNFSDKMVYQLKYEFVMGVRT